MTPAVQAAIAANIDYQLHEYSAQGDGAGRHWGTEAAEQMGVLPQRVFKTLIVQVDGSRLAVGIVPVACELNLKAMAAALGDKKVVMAQRAAAERSTGYVLGGISPLGQRQTLATVVDTSAAEHATVFVSGGRRGLEIELAPVDLATVCSGSFGKIARW